MMDVTVTNKLLNAIDDLTRAVKQLQKSIDGNAPPKVKTRYCGKCKSIQAVNAFGYSNIGVPVGCIKRVLYCDNCNSYLDEEITCEEPP